MNGMGRMIDERWRMITIRLSARSLYCRTPLRMKLERYSPFRTRQTRSLRTHVLNLEGVLTPAWVTHWQFIGILPVDLWQAKHRR